MPASATHDRPNPPRYRWLRRSEIPTLLDGVLLRRPVGADCRYTQRTFAQFAAILIWHAVVPIAILSILSEQFIFPDPGLIDTLFGWTPRSEFQYVLFSLAPAVVLTLIEFLLAFVVYRIAHRGLRAGHPGRSIRTFIAAWWRGCLLGTIVLPLLHVFAWLIIGHAEPATALWPCYLVPAPALLAAPLMRKRSSWRPVCRECGFNVFHATRPRCSECGAGYPTADRFYRRWAIRRLPWDQASRTLPIAWIQTLLLILLRPSAAAWRLANPDRMGRAVRWAIGHLVAPTVLLLLLAGGVLAYAWYAGWIRSPYPPGIVLADGNQTTPAFIWGVQWFIAWTIVLAFPALLGVGLAAMIPCIQPAVRCGLIKWSLYAQPVTVAAVAVGIGALSLGFLPFARFPWMFVSLSEPRQVYLVKLAAIGYALWWAIGAASQPYASSRGFLVFLAALFSYLTAWQCTLRLFNLRGFESFL